MLKKTFIHLPKVGPATELQFWRQGLHTWEDFLKAGKVRGLSPLRLEMLQKELASSLKHLENPDYFGRRLPFAEHWRLFEQYRPQTAYLDIETIGSTWPHLSVTVIGLYDGRGFRQFILGENLADFPEVIRNYQILVTFNGSQFDLPVLATFFNGWRFQQTQIDLRFVLARLGIKGGLKRIERQFGLERPLDVAGLDGYDAVLLWQRYQRGDQSALETLRRYNREDVINLERLMERAYELSCQRVLAPLAQ
ncbi:hypothetical protein Desac_2397 [Desulfobacca acetoxidans DSM 11109]|uniref:YprB ribonuclease H-like domain-containing protein n=1 Tax=Desulfobacca acetoxidans (strain ATCC 700848 / DSM 11109 / ASRB2) TaxID=880072 RepID=F2NFU9_DESAR|nr:hypothetical protein Desac_2397 [Desulfobacca acetoxidans DSM 11109]